MVRLRQSDSIKTHLHQRDGLLEEEEGNLHVDLKYLTNIKSVSSAWLVLGLLLTLSQTSSGQSIIDPASQ